MPVKVLGGRDESNQIPDPLGFPWSGRVTARQAPGPALASPSVMAKSLSVVEHDNESIGYDPRQPANSAAGASFSELAIQ